MTRHSHSPPWPAPPFRPAAPADCRRIAELFAVASAGVSVLVWTTMADDYPGLSPIEIGEQRYARENTDFSYQNCIVADENDAIIGMLVTFAIPEETEDTHSGEDAEADPNDPLAPYAELGGPGSWYICGVAVEPDHQGRGLGTAFPDIARRQARERGLDTLSLIVFAQNTGALRLYEREGFTVIDSRPVIPHLLIEYTGEALLMTAKV